MKEPHWIHKMIVWMALLIFYTELVIGVSGVRVDTENLFLITMKVLLLIFGVLVNGLSILALPLFIKQEGGFLKGIIRSLTICGCICLEGSDGKIFK